MNNKRKTIIFKIILAIGIIFVLLGILAKWIVGPIVTENIVYKEMAITEGTLGYDTWVGKFGKHIILYHRKSIFRPVLDLRQFV